MDSELFQFCEYCVNWVPNGGVLHFGYCLADKDFGYRRFNQSCCKFVYIDPVLRSKIYNCTLY